MKFPVVLKKVCGNFRVSAIKKEVESALGWVIKKNSCGIPMGSRGVVTIL